MNEKTQPKSNEARPETVHGRSGYPLLGDVINACKKLIRQTWIPTRYHNYLAQRQWGRKLIGGKWEHHYIDTRGKLGRFRIWLHQDYLCKNGCAPIGSTECCGTENWN